MRSDPRRRRAGLWPEVGPRRPEAAARLALLETQLGRGDRPALLREELLERDRVEPRGR
jgi:hypothetical protein